MLRSIKKLKFILYTKKMGSLRMRRDDDNGYSGVIPKYNRICCCHKAKLLEIILNEAYAVSVTN